MLHITSYADDPANFMPIEHNLMTDIAIVQGHQ